MGWLLVLVWILVAALMAFMVWISVRGVMGMLSDLRLGHHPQAFRQGPIPSRRERTVAPYGVHTTPRFPRRAVSCTSHWSLTPLGAARVAGREGFSADRRMHGSVETSNRKFEGRNSKDAQVTAK